MQLDRDINPSGKGKYALIKLRDIPGDPRTPEELAAAILRNPECVDFGTKGSDSEFFPIRLKDAFAPAALRSYAGAAQIHDGEYASEVMLMADRAECHTGRKLPD